MSNLIKFAASSIRRYDDLLIKYPVKMKMATAGVVASLGDIFCQKVVENKTWEEYYGKRTITQALVGVFFMAPAAHTWFSKILPFIISQAKSKSSRLMASIFFDNTLYGATVLASSIFIFGLFKTHNVPQSWKKIQNKFTIMYEAAMNYWVTVSLINHVLLPGRYKGIFSNASGVVWKVYLSHLMHINDDIPLGAALPINN